jgi:phospholipid N-methyltransferase
MSCQIVTKFHLQSYLDLQEFFPKEKNDLNETVKVLSKRFFHYLNTGIWIDRETVLNFTYSQDLHISHWFSQQPIQRSFKRIEQGTFIPKSDWPEIVDHTLTFFNNFVQDPQQVGALLPSSKALSKEMVRHIPKFELDLQSTPRFFLEVGPGTGSFTDKIIKRLGPHDVLHLVELDNKFCELLRKKYAKLIDSRKIEIFNVSILNQSESFMYDFIISGLPLNSFSPDFVKKIFLKLEKLGKDGSKLSYFEYLLIPTIKRIFSEEIERIQQIKDAFEKKHPLGTADIYFNVLPAKVRHHCIRKVPSAP